MKRRKYGIIIGAVITTLLMISSATAVSYSNEEAFGEEEGQTETDMGNNPPVMRKFFKQPPWINVYVGKEFGAEICAVDADYDDIKYKIDWGDGTVRTTEYMPQGTYEPLGHTYESTGWKTARGKAIDEHGATSATWSFRVFVRPNFKSVGAKLLSMFLGDEINDGSIQTTQTQDPADGTFGEEPATPPGGDDEEEEEQPDSEYYVDPDVELTSSAHLSKLETFVNKINDPKYVVFTQELINELKNDGKVDAQDIEAILGRHESLAGSVVNRGIISGTAGGYTPAHGFPFRPHLIRPRGADCMISWPGPGLGVSWDCTYVGCANNIHFTLRGETIDYKHTGIAFFQVGYWENLGWKLGCALFQAWEFSITAYSPLVLITPE